MIAPETGYPTRLVLIAGLLAALAWGGPSAESTAPADTGSAPVGAVQTGGLPDSAEVEARIKELESAKTLDETVKASLLEQLNSVLTYLESARAFDAKAGDYTESLETAPAQAATLRKQAAAGGRLSEPPAADLKPEAIAQRLGQIQTEATRVEAQQAELDKLIEGGTVRRSAALDRLGEIGQALERLESEGRASPPQGQSTQAAEAMRWVRAARQRALRAETRAIEQELASQEVREDLYRAQREQAAAALERIKRDRGLLESLKVQRSKADAEQAIEETKEAQQKAADQHPLVGQLAKQNSEITASLARVADQLGQLNTQTAQIDREHKELEDNLRRDRERIQVAGLNQALGHILMDRRTQIPDVRRLRKTIAQRGEQISEETLHLIRYREEQRRLQDLGGAVAALIAQDPSADSAQVRDQARELLERRRTLLEQGLAAEADFIRRLGELNYVSEQLIETAGRYDAFLVEHLLWVRSVPPVGIHAFGDLSKGIRWLTSPDNWAEVLRVLAYEARNSPVSWLGLLLVTVLLWRGSRIKRAIVAAAQPLRRIGTDAFRHTLKALGLTLIAALPLSLLFLLAGRELSLSFEATPFTRAMGAALLSTAMGLYFLRTFRLLCIPGGVADRHFRWSSTQLGLIRRSLSWFTPFIIPMGILSFAVFHLNDPVQSASLGRLVLTLGLLGSALFFAQLLNPASGVFAETLAALPQGWANRLRKLWFPLVVGTPLVLIALVLLGFMYTAGTLFRALAQTAWLALLLTLAQQTIVRWLILTRRRLALQAALERQAARRAQAAEKTAPGTASTSELGPIEEPEVNLASLDEQTRTLLNAAVFFASLIGLWVIWSEMLPAFKLLDQYALWHYQGVVDGTQQSVPVTVADMALVLAILVFALVAAKNLPALIEILLLQATSVTAGTRFAVKTLISYAIATIAFLSAFGTLGLSWSQVQWLVAALSVGIGFGLQEIVANFISGLIILFERPVRVGDVVTIGDTTGVVTNIRIRATTIRNWDRQELLVPNKEFITGRLLNWTLSDQVTRIVISVGVEYGSDTELALSLLTQAAVAHPKVIKDPGPIVSFDGFGDNALNLTLRCFLDSVDHRVGVTSELHRDIDRRFAEHGIVIAFPQRDIHLSTREPIEIRVRREPRTGGDNRDGRFQSLDRD